MPTGSELVLEKQAQQAKLEGRVDSGKPFGEGVSVNAPMCNGIGLRLSREFIKFYALSSFSALKLFELVAGRKAKSPDFHHVWIDLERFRVQHESKQMATTWRCPDGRPYDLIKFPEKRKRLTFCQLK